MNDAHDKRHYEPITTREFRSTIPVHVLAHMPDSERHFVDTLSRQESHIQWLEDKLVKVNEAVMDLDQRVMELEEWKAEALLHASTLKTFMDEYPKRLATQAARVDKIWEWKQMISGKWAVLGALGLLLGGEVVRAIAESIAKSIK